MTMILRGNCCDPPCPSGVQACDDCDGDCCCTEEFNPFPSKVTVWTYNESYWQEPDEFCNWPIIEKEVDDLGDIVTKHYGGDWKQEYLFDFAETGAPGNFSCKSDGSLGWSTETFCDDLDYRAEYNTGSNPIYYADCNGWPNSGQTGYKSLEIGIHGTYESGELVDNCNWYILGLGSAGADFFLPISPGDTTVEGAYSYSWGVGSWYWIITLTY